MAKKKKHEEHENHERWLVSYADFITLLFAFFTSMYAISTANEVKFRALSKSLNTAFSPSHGQGQGLFATSAQQGGSSFIQDVKPTLLNENDIYTNRSQKVRSALKDIQKDGRLTLLFGEQKIIIRISEGILFEPSSDEFIKDGLPVLDEIAEVLKDMPNSVNIEGHTDNIPTNTGRFPSNWDLSSARAVKILKYFISAHKYDPTKLAATGYGEYRPVTSNDTPEGRAKNRRVDILLISEGNYRAEE